MAGESGPTELSLPKAMTIAAFFGVSVYNSIEILFSIFHRFRTHKGLYFWSMLIACIGIPVHAIAVLLRNFGLAPSVPMCVFIILGWWSMVTGQAVVLYSRLHLVRDEKKLRWVLMMIITNFAILHLPVSGLYLATNINPDNTRLTYIFSVYEKVQLTGFSVQEWVIAGLYIWGAYSALNPILKFKGPRERKVLRYLVLVNLIVIAMDGSLLLTEFTDNFEIQTTYKTVVYSIKLKLEFYVLNQLVFIIHNPTSPTFRTPQESEPAPSTEDRAESVTVIAKARMRSCEKKRHHDKGPTPDGHARPYVNSTLRHFDTHSEPDPWLSSSSSSSSTSSPSSANSSSRTVSWTRRCALLASLLNL
ncbi:hypothetical protein P171DRAFT_454050 [Karstenula rhodostoma CBS 690.94]|uniref:DUF7703 domain-containing protein n=1 Tax=Karstenula rhodostoma CBS 690.94 TaxID=1392251 RepID=A0A9P4PLQ2_9PLEO|nr:hypothetical protein P171DRAFT_454050 [Karstenula rhodostoma CBS 690.94]